MDALVVPARGRPRAAGGSRPAAERSEPPPVRLRSLATAVPGPGFSQEFITRHARAIFSPVRDDFDRLEPIFEHTGIKTRYSVETLPWFLQPQDWPSRMASFMEGAKRLYREVATRAMEEAGLLPREIDTLVTISSTGFAVPSIEARVLHELGFRNEVRRVPVFGVGCAGGVTGIALASRLAAARPGENILVVVIELCSLISRPDDYKAANIVASAIFGDGAAAAVISAGEEEGGLAVLGESGEHTWPDTLDIMGWRVDPIGFGVILSRSIPEFVGNELRPVTEAFLARNGLALADIAHFAFHPGGAKVVDALERAFDLPAGARDRERAVLRDYGNMSSPTVLFVMRGLLDDDVRGRGLMSALGPGFTASYLLFER